MAHLSSWFPYRRPQPAPPRVRLIGLPYAGAMGNVFRLWGSAMPADVELCSVELPARGSRRRELPAASLDAIVNELVPAIEGMGDEPVVLFGHSLGGLLAFELAHHLSALGRPPVSLMISACPHPAVIPTREGWDELPDAQFIERIRRLQGGPTALLDRRDVQDVYLPILRGDLRLFRTHPLRVRSPLSMPIDVFGATDDPYWSPRDLEGWALESTRVELHLFAGGHFFIQSSQASVLRVVNGVLERITP